MPLTDEEKVIEIFTRVFYNCLYEEMKDKDPHLPAIDLLQGIMNVLKGQHKIIEEKVTNETINHEVNYPKGSNVIPFRQPRKK